MNFLVTGPDDAATTLILAHGAGAAMDTPFMTGMATELERHGIRVVRFEFGYMAGRRGDAGRKPPPKAEKLIGEYRDAVAGIGARGRVLIGGKSMGGRVASMVADDLHAAGAVAGLVCLGYPFHPPGKPAQLRTAHLERLAVPALICQGTRDPFGTRDEVGDYKLSPAITLHWLEDGDHDFKARKASGVTTAQNMASAIEAIAGWAGRLG